MRGVALRLIREINLGLLIGLPPKTEKVWGGVLMPTMSKLRYTAGEITR